MSAVVPSRRLFVGGLIAAIVAPAVIRTPGLLMPVRGVVSGDRVAERVAILRGWTSWEDVLFRYGLDPLDVSAQIARARIEVEGLGLGAPHA